MDQLLQLKNVEDLRLGVLHDVNFHVGQNEIVGLLVTTAPAFTLIKIMTGYHRPDPGGEIYWKGQRLEHLNVAKARKLGINPVYQERASVDLALAQHLPGGELRTASGVLDIKKMRSETARLMNTITESPVKTMSGWRAARGVAITRALSLSRCSSSSWTSPRWGYRYQKPGRPWILFTE